MLIRDRIYTAACMLPPSPERTTILELCTLLYRQSKLNDRKRVALEHYREILKMMEDGHKRYPTPIQLPAIREAHAQFLARKPAPSADSTSAHPAVAPARAAGSSAATTGGSAP